MMRARTEGLLDVVLGGVPLEPSAIVSLDAWLAVDRPDRLEVLVALDDLDGGRDEPSLPAAGTPVSVVSSSGTSAAYPLVASGEVLFEGIVTRHRLEWSAGGGARLRWAASGGARDASPRPSSRVAGQLLGLQAGLQIRCGFGNDSLPQRRDMNREHIESIV